MKKDKWIYITSKHPYDAACSLGINKEVSFILTVPHLNWDMIEEYKYLADNPDNAELDAIIVNEVGVIANRKVLEHNLKDIKQLSVVTNFNTYHWVNLLKISNFVEIKVIQFPLEP